MGVKRRMGGHLSRRPDATRPITAVWFAPVEHPAAPDPTPLKIVRVGLEAAAWLLEPLGFSEWGDPAAALDAPGVRVSRVVHIDPRGHHTWWGVAPHAHVEAELTHPALKLRGSGYHDANFGDEPLEAAFVDWNWSRASLTDRATVLYDARRVDGSELRLGRVFHLDGRTEELEAPRRAELGRTRWLLPRTTRTDGAEARVVRTLEDTPFYARSQLQTSLGGRSMVAVHESLSLARFASPMVQTMLPFRIRRGG